MSERRQWIYLGRKPGSFELLSPVAPAGGAGRLRLAPGQCVGGELGAWLAARWPALFRQASDSGGGPPAVAK